MAKEAAAIAVNRIFKTFLTSAPAAAAVDGAAGTAEATVKTEGKQGAASLRAGAAVTAIEPGDGDNASESAEGGGMEREMDAVPAGGLGETQEKTQEKSVTDIGGGLRREPLSSEELEPLALTMSDFEEAVERVQVSVCKHARLYVYLDLARVARSCACACARRVL